MKWLRSILTGHSNLINTPSIMIRIWWEKHRCTRSIICILHLIYLPLCYSSLTHRFVQSEKKVRGKWSFLDHLSYYNSENEVECLNLTSINALGNYFYQQLSYLSMSCWIKKFKFWIKSNAHFNSIPPSPYSTVNLKRPSINTRTFLPF